LVRVGLTWALVVCFALTLVGCRAYVAQGLIAVRNNSTGSATLTWQPAGGGGQGGTATYPRCANTEQGVAAGEWTVTLVSQTATLSTHLSALAGGGTVTLYLLVARDGSIAQVSQAQYDGAPACT
jgi:hypothetical protein